MTAASQYSWNLNLFLVICNNAKIRVVKTKTVSYNNPRSAEVLKAEKDLVSERIGYALL